MKYIIVLVTTLTFFISCNTFRNKKFLSKPDDIIPDEYVIDINRDTVLMTKHGALLNIPKGSLATGDENTVTLEIKEAYSLEQMIKSGLTTQSIGEMLSSGGMIYINAKGGQNVTIKQAIKVAVPADYLNPAMQLYKGEKEDDGTINWTTPLPLPENKKLTIIESGNQLFQRSCANCHLIGKDATGPDLAHFLKRFSGDKLLVRGHTVHHPSWFRYNDQTVDTSNQEPLNQGMHINSELWDNQFLYFCNLKGMYGSLGPLFPDLDEEALNAIYSYIQNETDSRSLPLPSIAYLDGCIDSCTQYLTKSGKLLEKKNALESKRNNLIEDNGPLVKETKYLLPLLLLGMIQRRRREVLTIWSHLKTMDRCITNLALKHLAGSILMYY